MGDNSQSDINFDDIIEKVGNNGFFQTRFYWTFNFALPAFAAMVSINKFISLNVPDHWCHVPGRETTNYTLQQWKQLTIPLIDDFPGSQSYSKCTRFANGTTANTFDTSNTIKCDQGWVYDRTWYDSTTAMQNDWVCDDQMIPINILALINAGEMISSLIYGQIADNYGRMTVYYSALFSIIIARILSIYTSSWLYLFMFLNVLCSQTVALFQCPFVIGIEIAPIQKRGFINLMVAFSYSLGTVISPLFMWCLRGWVSYSLITILLGLLFLCCHPWMIESPRWLASKSKTKKCVKQLEKIAKANKMPMPNNIDEELKIYTNRSESSTRNTVLGFFSSLRLAKNAIITIYCYSITIFMYISFILSVSNLDGNPYLNYSLQAMADLPAYMIGKYVCDRFGRRFITFTGFILTSIGLVVIAYLINDASNLWRVNILCIFLKAVLILTLYSAALQSTEIYPTCLRQSGVSTGSAFADLMTTFAPYIVALGVTANASIPYVIYAVCTIIGAIGCIFLPETLGHQLPETLKDAAQFGADQDFLGRSKPKRNIHHEAEVPLNKI